MMPLFGKRYGKRWGQSGVVMAMTKTAKKFLGVGCLGSSAMLVARFQAGSSRQHYYMTMQELCDWVENQRASGLSCAAVAVDRDALVALIEAQRRVLAGKASYAAFNQVKDGCLSFADYATAAAANDAGPGRN